MSCSTDLWKPICTVVIHLVSCDRSFLKQCGIPPCELLALQMAIAFPSCIVLWETTHLLLSKYLLYRFKQGGKKGTSWFACWLWGFFWYQPLLPSCLWVACGIRVVALKLLSAKCIWSVSLAAPSNWLSSIAECPEQAHSQWQSLNLSCLHVLVLLRSISCVASDPISEITDGCLVFTVYPLCHLY